MEKRKVLRKKRRFNLGIRRSIATFLTIAMLSAASMSAVAFAVNADDHDGVVATEEAVVYTPAVEAPEVEAAPEPVAPEAEVADEPATDEGEAYAGEVAVAEGLAEEYYIEIEPLVVLLTDDAYILADSAGPGMPAVDTGFDTLADALASVYAVPGVTINLQHDASHGWLIPGIADLTLNLNGHTLALTGGINVLAAGTGFTLAGGTVNAPHANDGRIVVNNATANLAGTFNTVGGLNVTSGTVTGSANINATNPLPNGITALAGSTVTVGNVSAMGYGVAVQGSTVTINGNVASANDAGVLAVDGAQVTINGNITAGTNGIEASENAVVNANGTINAVASGIVADGTAAVTAVGNITANEDAVTTLPGSNANVTVTGDLTSGWCGVHAYGVGTVTIFGDINSEQIGITAGLGSSTVVVTGNINAGMVGILAEDNVDVAVAGNIIAEWAGIVAEGNASVHLTGDITSELGVEAWDNAQVRVTGVITADEYVIVEGIDLASNEHDATSTLDGYRQFSRDNAVVWVYGIDAYQPGGTTPSTPTTPTVPTPPVDDGDDAGDDDGDDGDDDAAAGNRRPATGPQTGDANNWFAQIAALAVLVVTLAGAGLLRTREQS